MGLLLVLLHWTKFRRSVAHRSVALVVMRLMLERTCDAGALHGMRGHTANVEHMAQCAGAPGPNLPCRCLAKALATQRTGSPQEAMAVTLAQCFAQRTCSACTAHLRHLLLQVSAMVDDRAEEWGITDLRSVGDLALMGRSGKRRRCDPHLRHLVAGGQPEGLAGQPLAGPRSGFAESTVRQWAAQHCCECQAACHLSLSTGVVFSAAFDGVRLGKPALEMLLAVAGDVRQNRWCILPPAVRRRPGGGGGGGDKTLAELAHGMGPEGSLGVLLLSGTRFQKNSP